MCQKVNLLADQVMQRCDELAQCSEEDCRLTRRFLTAPMHDVHTRMQNWLRTAELDSRVDNVGNIVGRRTAEGAKRTLLLGSHLDTVPNAGKFDGVLGVLIALAVVEALGEERLPFHLDVIGFSEEEGVRYNLPYLGSSAAAGMFRDEWLERLDCDGVALRSCLSSYGLDSDEIAAAAYQVDEVIGYVEAHLEQGPVLERAGLPLGVVSGIAGQSRLRLEFLGAAGHAGTTPMKGRCDALAMAAEFVLAVQKIGQETKSLRATVGQLQIEPDAPNVIPGRAVLALEVRHADDAIRECAVDELLSAGVKIAEQSGGTFAVSEQIAERAVAVDANLNHLLAEAIVHCGHPAQQLVSGAGHDAVMMAERFPVAMLFLRHPGGVSHHPDEYVERDDVATAIEVMTHFVRALAQQYDPSRLGVSKTR